MSRVLITADKHPRRGRRDWRKPPSHAQEFSIQFLST